MKTFWKQESGATLVEYGVALIVAITLGGAGLVALAGQTSENSDQAVLTMAQR